jgi:NitT/TauT family transport system substrate-binding protein
MKKWNEKNERSKKKRTLALALALMAIMLLSACGGGQTDSGSDSKNGSESGVSEKADNGKFTIKVSDIGTDPTRVDPVLIGLEKGFWDEAGIEIEDVGAIEIPQRVSALTSGTTDVASAMTSEGLMAIDGGAPIIGVATGCVTSPEKTHMVFVTKKGSDIKRGRDLVGKKVVTASVVGGCTAGFPLEYAKQDGVEDPINEIELVAAPEDVLIETVLRGDADVAGVHLIPEQIETLYPDVEILFTDYDFLEDRGGDTAWFFRKDFVDENTEGVKKFAETIGKINNWINENNEEAKTIYKEKALAVNEDLVWVAYLAPDGKADASHTQLWIDLFKQPGQVLQLANTEIKPEDVVTNAYLDSAS